MGFREGDGNEVERPEQLKLTEDENENKVSLDEPEEDEKGEGEDEEPEKQGDDGRARKKDGTWAAKKAERGRDRKAAKAWETEKADYERRFRQMREDSDRTARQLREDMDRLRQQAGGERAPRSPIDGQLDDIEKQLEKELALIEADPNRGYREYNRLRRQEQRLISTQALHEHAAEQQRQAANQPRDVYASRRPIIESEYPWVMDDGYRELAQRARAYKDYLVQVERRPDTIETDRAALAYVQANFGPEYGLRPPPAPPSQRTRSIWAPPASRGTPERRPQRREVDLGALGQGHGLSVGTLREAVVEAINDENG